MLQKTLAKILQMRRPDLEYLLLNSFEHLRQTDFFIAQEFLHGKSICDICLNTPKYIIEAVDKLKAQENKTVTIDPYKLKSYLEHLINGD